MSENKSTSSEEIQGDLAPKGSQVLLTSVASQNRKSKRVLDEDTYSKELENIIERDFFPDVPKLKAQTEYLEALENNDISKIRELQEKYQPQSSRSDAVHLFSTPSTFETPIHDRPLSPTFSQISQMSEKEKNEEIKKVSLDTFLSKNTSEDNASFEAVMEETKRRHQEKMNWMYQDEKAEGQGVERLLSEPHDPSKPLPPAPVTWKYKNQNYLMYTPDGAELTREEKLRYSKRQDIAHPNSRFEKPPFNEVANQEAIAEAAALQAKAKEGKVGIDGKEVLPQASPKVNGYGFVGTPSPGVAESPIMTWGEIEGTPFLLDGSDTPIPKTPGGPQFKIPEPPSRERLALSLADSVVKKKRAQKAEALRRVHTSLLSPRSPLGTPSPKSPLDQLGSMSPAAQRLARAKLGIHRDIDHALRASYTPSPSSGNETLPSRTPQPSPRRQRTPLTDSSDVFSLTDNLLNLPKRKRAADFF